LTTNVVPGFDSIIDQERPLRALRTLLSHATIPHALLFTGIEGVGKRSAAVAFAMACNCRSPLGIDPCGACSACRRIAADTHPDVLRVSPSGNQIKIDQVRELCRVLEMKPYEARVRVVLIAEAQRMNAAAGNALLKMLEEPPPGTVLVLTALQAADLLPTVVSRCRHFRFKPIARDLLAGMLEKAYGFPAAEAALTAAMAGGSVTRALAMLRSGWAQRREGFMRAMAGLADQPTTQVLALAERMARSKDDVPEVLDLLASWIRDLAVARHDPGRILHQDRRDEILAAARRVDDAFCVNAAAALDEVRRRVPTANSRLGLEWLLTGMAAAMRAGAIDGRPSTR
jgi:DNA polymerase-3 subunit delta'